MAQPAPLALAAPAPEALPRLRDLKPALIRQARSVAAGIGSTATIDGGRLAAAVLDWSRGPGRGDAGHLLRHLLQQAPLTIPAPGPVPAPAPAVAAATPSGFWPEGVALVRFCLALRATRPGPALDDLRLWWSFRENMAEDPARAPAFLDLFAGAAPAGATAAPTPRPALRLVHPARRLRLPRGTTLALIDIALLCNLPEVEAAVLADLVRAHGVVPTADLHPSAAMTLVALKTGRICPRRFTEALDTGIARRMPLALRPDPGAEAALAALRARGIGIGIVGGGTPARLKAALRHLPAGWASLAGELPTARSGTAIVLAQDPRLTTSVIGPGPMLVTVESGLGSIDWTA